MNKIDKFLAKLGNHDFNFVLELIRKIRSNDLQGLNITKLEGHSSTYRLKKGDFRIIFSKNSDDAEILSVVRRSEKTYRDF